MLDRKGPSFLFLAFFEVLTLLLLPSYHNGRELLINFGLQGRIGLFRGGRNDAGLSWGDVELVELDWVHGGYDGVVARIVGERDGADASGVSRHGAFVPGDTEFGKSNGYRGEISSVVVVGTQLFIKLEVLGNLADVDMV